VGHNVQSQAGVSLADVYDIKGSQAPIERLLTTEVPVVHEMGATIQSERFSTFIRRSSTGDLGQSTAWDIEIVDLPAGVTRILGLSVIADVRTRTNIASVLIRDPIAGGGRELPIWVWDNVLDAFKDVRIEQEGTVGDELALVSTEPLIQTLLVGPDQPQSVGEIAFRGITSAFGAGTVEHVLLLHIALAAIGGISSRGLPVPSW